MGARMTRSSSPHYPPSSSGLTRGPLAASAGLRMALRSSPREMRWLGEAGASIERPRSRSSSLPMHNVIPAKAGTPVCFLLHPETEVPAFAGMTLWW